MEADESWQYLSNRDKQKFIDEYFEKCATKTSIATSLNEFPSDYDYDKESAKF